MVPNDSHVHALNGSSRPSFVYEAHVHRSLAVLEAMDADGEDSSYGVSLPPPLAAAKSRSHTDKLAMDDSNADDEDSWQMNNSDDSDLGDGAASAMFVYGAPAFCTNCTAQLAAPGECCNDCGHAPEDDAALFDGERVSDGSSPRAEAGCPVLLWDDGMLQHEEREEAPHPERPDRLRAIMARLSASGVAARCNMLGARPATDQELLAVHTLQHLQRLRTFCSGLDVDLRLPSDTYMNEHTLSCAALAAGSAVEVAVAVARRHAPCGAAIIRPPGHHAESNTSMGFCFFNNAAVAARAAQANGARRVLILDWDVHHGNGTQHIFEDDPTVLYMSLHRYDRGSFYPGTGGPLEVGIGAGAGFSVNVAWDAGGMGDGDYLAAFQQVLLPIAREFAPDLLLISAGFDAAEGDPIGGCCVSAEAFGHMTAALMPIAPCVLLLEGGYNLTATARSTEACLRVLLGERPPPLPGQSQVTPFGRMAILTAQQVQARYWSCLARTKPAAVAVAASVLRQPEGNPLQRLQQRRWQQQQQQPGGARQEMLKRLGRKQAVLRAIQQAAMRSFWRRRQRQAAIGAASK